MKVFLRVAVDVSADKPQDVRAVKEAVEEAVWNALEQAEDVGYDHAMSDQVSIIADYVEAYDTDLHNDR